MESLALVKKSLNKNGVIIINCNGFFEGEKGRANQSLINTLEKSGFGVLAISNAKKKNGGNLILISCRKEEMRTLTDVYPFLESEGFKIIDGSGEGTVVFTDDNILMEYLSLGANLTWRRGYINSLLPYLERNGIPAIK